jgi:hypothetical protein
MGFVPPGTTAFNWLRAQQLRTVTQTSGLQLTRLKPSDPNQICGRQIDSSVAVGGVGNIPITSDTITPDLIQGHAFVAPTYIDAHNSGNNLTNGSAQLGLQSWGTVEASTGRSTFSFDNVATPGEFTIDYAGGAPVDSLIVQVVHGLTPGATMVLSGLLTISHIGSSASFAGIDVLRLDANSNGLAIGGDGAVMASDYSHNAVQAASPFSLTFVVPISGNVQIRMHNRNNGTNDGIGSAFGRLKLEYGTVPTSYDLQSFSAITDVDIAGVMHSINVSATFTNIPMNAVKILWVFRNTNSATWTPWAETSIPGVPYPAKQQLLTFGFGQLAFGISYDFGAAFVDLAGNTGAISAFVTNYNPTSSLFTVNSSYMKSFGGTFTPHFLTVPALGVPLSANGISSSVKMDFTFDNQPVDGSLSRVSLWYRVTPPGGPTTPEGTAYKYTFYGSVPASGVGNPLVSLQAQGTYSFVFTDLTNNTSYDFGASCEDASGGETAIIYANTFVAQNLVLPTGTLPTHPSNAYINAQATSIQVGQSGQSSYYSQVSVTLAVTDGAGGAVLDPTAWLSQISFLAKPIASGSPSGDQDFNPNDYTNCKTVYTNTFSNPLVVTIGPFPANITQEIAVQLVDQAGKTSNANPFLIIAPPSNSPVFDAQGHLQYISFGTQIQQIVTQNGNLQSGIVARAQMANPEAANNLLFNPQSFFTDPATGWAKFWYTYSATPASATFSADPFTGGRFRADYRGGAACDCVLYQQLSNLVPGQPMVMSGLIEIGPELSAGFIGVDAFDPIGGGLLASAYFTSFQAATYFEKVFVIPASGAVQIRYHCNNQGSGSAFNAYMYKIQLEHGATASPFNDAMSVSAAANIMTPNGQMIAVSNNITGGEIDYNAAPGSVRAVINNTNNTYNANLATPGSTVPYNNTNGAFQIAIGSDASLKSGRNIALATHASSGAGVQTVTPGGITTRLQLSYIESLAAGTWQIFATFTYYAISAQAQILVGTYISDIPSTNLPSGFTGAVNCNTYGPVITGQNTISCSFICSGQQQIRIDALVNGSGAGSSASTGIITIQAVKIG